MNATTKKEINAWVKRVQWQCEMLVDDRVSLKDWENYLLTAIQEVHALVEVKAVQNDQQQRDAKVSLLSWALDVQTMDFVNAKHITLDKKTQWRWVDKDLAGIPGEVNGLARLRGIPRITNGILLYIEKEDGSVCKVHLDSFIKDKTEKPKKDSTEKKKTAKENAFQKRIAEYA